MSHLFTTHLYAVSLWPGSKVFLATSHVKDMNPILVIVVLLVLFVALRVALAPKEPTRGTRRFEQATPLPLMVYRPPADPYPDHFDWREKGMPIRIPQQWECGSCWAFAPVCVLGERIWLQTNGEVGVSLSAQYLLNCEVYCQDITDIASCDEGCLGGLLEHSWLFLREYGTPSESCQPYMSRVTSCQREECTTPGVAFKAYHAKEIYHVTDGTRTTDNEKRIMYEVSRNGPVSASFTSFEDLRTFRGSGIYRVGEAPVNMGGHAVQIIGWGPGYWLLANQFGRDWGDQGVCKYPRGEDYHGIESQVVAGMPA